MINMEFTDKNVKLILERAFKDTQNAMEKLASEGSANMALDVHSEIVRSMKRKSSGRRYRRGKIEHVASKPGDAPNIDTGALVQSVFIKPTGASYLVGTAIKYGSYLEFGTKRMFPRPWLLPAARKIQRSKGRGAYIKNAKLANELIKQIARKRRG